MAITKPLFLLFLASVISAFSQTHPLNDDFADARDLGVITNLALYDTNLANATLEFMEYQPLGAVHSMWYKFQVPSEGNLAITSTNNGSSFYWHVDTGVFVTNLTVINLLHLYPGITYYLCAAGLPSFSGTFQVILNFTSDPASAHGNDYFNYAYVLHEGTNVLQAPPGDGSLELSEQYYSFDPFTRTFWWKYTPSQSGYFYTLPQSPFGGAGSPVIFYQGTNITSLSSLGKAYFPDLLPFSPGRTYYIQMDNRSGPPVHLEVLLSDPPGNDHFANAYRCEDADVQVFSPYVQYVVTGQNVGATLEQGEPLPNSPDSTSTVWYSWTAPFTGKIGGAGGGTENGFFDFSIFCGSELGNLQLVGGMLTPFTFMAGERFYFQVSTRASEGPKAFFFNFLAEKRVAENDAFANAAALAMLRGKTNGFPQGASIEPGEPAHVNYPHKSLWWKYTAFEPGLLGLSTMNIAVQKATFAVYSGTAVDSLVLRQKAEGSIYERVNTGETVYIAVAVPEGLFEDMTLYYEFFRDSDHRTFQTISFPTPTNLVFGMQAFSPAVSSSGSGIEYFIEQGWGSVVDYDPAGLKIRGAGRATVTAFAPSSSVYLSAIPVSRTFDVAKAPSTVTFQSTGGFGNFLRLNAVASGGTPVSFQVISGPGFISKTNLLTLTTNGPVVVRASSPGDKNHEPGEAFQTFDSHLQPQTISLSVGGETVCTSLVSTSRCVYVQGTSSSGGPVQLSLASGPGELNGYNFDYLKVFSPGMFLIRGVQAGDGTHSAATSYVSVAISGKKLQLIDFPPIADRDFAAGSFTISASSSSALPVRFQVYGGPAFLQNRTIVEPYRPGQITIRAFQDGDATYESAPPVDRVFNVRGTQTISFLLLPMVRYGDGPVPLTAYASSGLPVQFQVISGPVRLDGTNLVILGAGNALIQAVQSGDGSYPAVSTNQWLPIMQASQTISFPPILNATIGGAPTQLQATSSAGLPVSYEVVRGPAEVHDGYLSLQGSGLVVVRASQAGDTNFEAAVSVEQSVDLARTAQMLVFPPPPAMTYGSTTVPLYAYSSSGLPVTFSVVSGPGVVNANVLEVHGAGQILVRAVQAGNSGYAPAAVDQTIAIARAPQTITFVPVASASIGGPAVSVNATASSGLPVTIQLVSGNGSFNDGLLSVHGAGAIVLRASQPGDLNYEPAAPVDAIVEVEHLLQSIDFPAIGPVRFGEPPRALAATSSSGLPVTFEVVSGPATVNEQGALVSTAAGDAVLRARQTGNDIMAPVQVDQTIQIDRAIQTITLDLPDEISLAADAIELNPASDSGGPITIELLSGPAALEGHHLTLLGTGPVHLRVKQSGDANYEPAVLERMVSVRKAPQTITFDGPSTAQFGGAPLPLLATSTSGLPVSFSVISGKASISNGLLEFAGAGTVIIHASQQGDSRYESAELDISLQVERAPQTIELPPIGPLRFGASPVPLHATSSSGLPVTFEMVSGPAIVTENSLATTGAGEVVVRATQPGNDDYAPASREQTVAIQRGTQSITFDSFPLLTFSREPFSLQAHSSSGLTVAFEVISGPATLDGANLLMSGAGVVRLRAFESGDTNYEPAENQITLLIQKAAQTIQFDAPAAILLQQSNVVLNATASSGLTVSFQIVTGLGLLNGSELTPAAAGPLVLRATQAGDDNYNPAENVEATINVLPAAEVALTLQNATLVLEWIGTSNSLLESAPSPAGPWTEVPFNNNALSGPDNSEKRKLEISTSRSSEFFRLRQPE